MKFHNNKLKKKKLLKFFDYPSLLIVLVTFYALEFIFIFSLSPKNSINNIIFFQFETGFILFNYYIIIIYNLFSSININFKILYCSIIQYFKKILLYVFIILFFHIISTQTLVLKNIILKIFIFFVIFPVVKFIILNRHLFPLSFFFFIECYILPVYEIIKFIVDKIKKKLIIIVTKLLKLSKLVVLILLIVLDLLLKPNNTKCEELEVNNFIENIQLPDQEDLPSSDSSSDSEDNLRNQIIEENQFINTANQIFSPFLQKNFSAETDFILTPIQPFTGPYGFSSNFSFQEKTNSIYLSYNFYKGWILSSENNQVFNTKLKNFQFLFEDTNGNPGANLNEYFITVFPSIRDYFIGQRIQNAEPSFENFDIINNSVYYLELITENKIDSIFQKKSEFLTNIYSRQELIELFIMTNKDPYKPYFLPPVCNMMSKVTINVSDTRNDAAFAMCLDCYGEANYKHFQLILDKALDNHGLNRNDINFELSRHNDTAIDKIADEVINAILY